MSQLLTESRHIMEQAFSHFCFFDTNVYVHSNIFSVNDFVTTTSETNAFSLGVSECFEYVSLPEPNTTLGSPYSLDDSQTRKRLWNMLFSNKTLPRIKKDAVEKNYGIMDEYFKKTRVASQDLKRIVEEALDE